MSLRGTYRKLLKNHFLAVQAVQTGALMGAGDSIAQLAVEKTDWRRYDLKRTALFAGLGLCFVVSTFPVFPFLENTLENSVFVRCCQLIATNLPPEKKVFFLCGVFG